MNFAKWCYRLIETNCNQFVTKLSTKTVRINKSNRIAKRYVNRKNITQLISFRCLQKYFPGECVVVNPNPVRIMKYSVKLLYRFGMWCNQVWSLVGKVVTRTKLVINIKHSNLDIQVLLEFNLFHPEKVFFYKTLVNQTCNPIIRGKIISDKSYRK